MQQTEIEKELRGWKHIRQNRLLCPWWRRSAVFLQQEQQRIKKEREMGGKKVHLEGQSAETNNKADRVNISHLQWDSDVVAGFLWGGNEVSDLHYAASKLLQQICCKRTKFTNRGQARNWILFFYINRFAFQPKSHCSCDVLEQRFN